MIKNFNQISKSALKDVAEFMGVAARTAPKTRGRDNLEMLIVDDPETRGRLARKMKEIGRENNRPSCIRDADNIKGTKYIIIIGTKSVPLGLDCGFCGFKTCEGLTRAKAVCIYNPLDLGIALGSAAGIASEFRVDNRLMHSIGKAAVGLGLFSRGIKIAIGIPLSATGKNPFFDRK